MLDERVIEAYAERVHRKIPNERLCDVISFVKAMDECNLVKPFIGDAKDAINDIENAIMYCKFADEQSTDVKLSTLETALQYMKI